MDKKKIIFILLILIVTLPVIIFLRTKDDEELPTQEEETTFVPDVIPNVNGIPEDLIDKTEKEFPLTLINAVTGENFEIKTTSKFTDFFEYVSLKDQSPELNLPEDVPLKTNETNLYVHQIIGKETTLEDDGVFVFGAVNENKEDTYFQDARTIYISYYGSSDWELCGIKTGMNITEVKNKIGNPAQKYADAEDGKTYEYHILKEEHTYSLILNIDKKDKVVKIALNIDNHAVY